MAEERDKLILVKTLLKFFKKSPRRALQLFTNFISAVLSGFPIATFFILLWKGPTYRDWDTNFGDVIKVVLLVIVGLYLLYKWGIHISPDEKERKNFHDNFYMSTLASIVVSLLIIFRDFTNENGYNQVIVILVILILFIASAVIVLRIKRPK